MGVDQKLTARTYTIIAALAVFVGLPLLLYALGDAPRRTVLKEVISILTLLAFFMMLGQYFLARSNETLLSLFKSYQIQKVHKYIAYTAVSMILIHPFLVVLPRFFEAGVMPSDAFVTMISTLDSVGILLGLAAWFLLLVLAATAYFRKQLMRRLTHRYRGWRHFHGAMAVTFTVLALWHSIELGRHTDIAMSALVITLALIGFLLLAGLYRGKEPSRPRSDRAAEGAST